MQLEIFGKKQNFNLHLNASILSIIGYQVLLNCVANGNNAIQKLYNVKGSNQVGKSYTLLFTISFTYFSSEVIIFLASLQRIKFINKLLKTEPKNQKDALIILNQCSKLHVTFLETVKLITTCHRFSLVMRLFEFIFHSTFLLFSVYNMFYNDLSVQSMVFFVNGIIFFLLITSLSFPLIIALSLIKQESLKFTSLFHKFQLKVFEKSGFLLESKVQVPQYDIVISCGIFNLDWKIIFAMFVAILSNTIILIQFDLIINNEDL